MSRTKKITPVKGPIGIQLKMGELRLRSFKVLTWKAFSPSSELIRSESFWHVKSSVTLDVLLKFLRLKYFWGELNSREIELLFSHPKVLDDVQFNVLLAVQATTELDKSTIIRRLDIALNFLSLKSSFRKELVQQWAGVVTFVADLETRSIRPHKRYSGWVRNSSSVGSKRLSNISIPEPLSEEFTDQMFDEYEFLYEFITVGSIETRSSFIRLS